MNKPIDSELTGQSMGRREFINRMIKAGVSVFAACSLGLWLFERTPVDISKIKIDIVTLPDFSINSMNGKMCIVRGADRIKTVNTALEALGGIGKFVKEGDRVLIKVNAAFATPPMLNATTSPELLAEVVRLCFKAGAKSVVVTDNPINDPSSCFSLTGLADAALSAGASVFIPKSSSFRPTTVTGGGLIKEWPLLYEPFRNVNKLIGMAPVKDHHRSGASMSMKNWYGLLGGRRNIFHQDINNIIKELAMMVTPTLVILDGTFSMITNGPTGGSLGDLKRTNTMIVSTDQVAADAYGAGLLGKAVSDMPYIFKAQEAKAGSADYESLSPIFADAG